MTFAEKASLLVLGWSVAFAASAFWAISQVAK